MKFRHQARTDIGRRRTSNEDSVYADEERGLFIVADGMGGHAAGEVASRLAVETIEAFVRAHLAKGPPPEEGANGHGQEDVPTAEVPIYKDDTTPPMALSLPTAAEVMGAAVRNPPPWPFGFEAAQSFPHNVLRNALQYANRVVIDATRERRQYRGMATTIVAVMLEGERLHIAHAGDSRAYLHRGDSLSRLTCDHSWVSEKVQAGELTDEEARVHPLRNMVTRAVGGKSELEVDVQSLPVRPEDLLLICSDGLTSMVPEPEIARHLAESREEAAAALVDAANAKGGDDNITVVVVRFED